MKKLFITLICCFLLFGLCGCESEEMKMAKDSFNSEVERINSEEKELDNLILECQNYLVEEPKVLFENTITELESGILQAKESKKDIPTMPKDEEEIKNITESTLKTIEYITCINDINDKYTAVKNSVEQLKQVSNPTSEFVFDRLKDLTLITGLTIVTEETDPYGNLNKDRSYSGLVFFTSSLVDQDKVFVDPYSTYGDIIVDKGTDAGGCVEIFTTEEDAKRRNDYLGNFDGTILSGGKHVVLGTLVVRSSDLLPLSQQTELETAVIESLIKLK